jgi:hypothetical protein
VGGEWEEMAESAKRESYRECGCVVEELWTRVESPVIVIKLNGERWRTVLMLVENSLCFPCQVVGHRRRRRVVCLWPSRGILISHQRSWYNFLP